MLGLNIGVFIFVEIRCVDNIKVRRIINVP